MPFKMVTESEKAAHRIAGNALAHAELIAGEQEAKWKDRLPAGQQGVTVEQMQCFYGEELRRRRLVMIDKERAYLFRLGEIREARGQRDAAVPELRDRLHKLRTIVEQAHGEEAARKLFFGKFSLPMDATPLARVARNVVGRLEDPAVELPAVGFGGTILDRAMLVEAISKPLVPIEEAMQDLDRLRALANQALEAKREAHAAVDWMNGRLARLLEALYAIEGHDVLAAKVRPSSHRAKKEDAEAAGGVADGRTVTAASREATRGEEAGTATKAAAAPGPAAQPSPAAPTGPAPQPAAASPSPAPRPVEPRRAAPAQRKAGGFAADVAKHVPDLPPPKPTARELYGGRNRAPG